MLFQRPGWDIHAVRHGNISVRNSCEAVTLQLTATVRVRWVSKSRVVWLTLKKEGARVPTRDYQERRPVTMNNDTRQVFGDDTRDYPRYPGPLADQDDEDFPAFR